MFEVSGTYTDQYGTWAICDTQTDEPFEFNDFNDARDKAISLMPAGDHVTITIDVTRGGPDGVQGIASVAYSGTNEDGARVLAVLVRR